MARAPAFRCEGGYIRDEHGRIRIFRGVNVSGRSKLPPFLPFSGASALDPLRAWGMNVIRLLVIWEALEPRRGEIDEAYLERIASLAEAAGARGLSVVVDVHQDLFARSFGGDGAPEWAVRHKGKATRGRRWFLHYFRSRPLRRSQEAFWCDEHGIRTAFMATMSRLVARMSRVDAVLGYDLWNEPMTRLRHVVSGRFERSTLHEFHQECAALVRDHDPTRLLFVEPPPVVALGAPHRMPALHQDGIVYAPHLYDSAAFASGRYLPQASTAPRSLAQAVGHAIGMRAPLFIGEFGALNAIRGAEQMIADQCRLLDRYFSSWTAWHYNPTDVDWNDEDASIVAPDGGDRPWTRHLVRPYPRALAGEPRRWESGRGQWRLQWIAAGDAPSEIVVPARWHAGRLRVEAAGGEATWNPDTGVVVVRAHTGDAVTLQLEPNAG
jgi:endoglycosylceramidase